MQPAAQGQGADLRVRPADREQISSEPRQVVATAFTVQNTSGAVIEVESRIVLPDEWRPVTPPEPFALRPGESALKLVSFTIPEDARAGEYAVRYEARDRLHPAASDSYSLQVRVVTSTRLQLWMDAPDFAVSGEEVAGAIAIRNSGNGTARVHFETAGRCIESVEPRQGEVSLEPGESKRIELGIVIGEMRSRCAGRVSVNATTSPDIHDSASATIQVLPRASALDAMRLLDSRAEARFVARETPLDRTFGWQVALAGGGMLDEQRRDLLRYEFRGPDRRQSGTFGTAEEYWVRYDSRHVDAGLGDLVYGLSPLTEPGRLGRGGQLQFQEGRWSGAAYDMKDVYGEGGADQVGVGAGVRLGSSTQLESNFLERNGTSSPGSIWSLRARSEGELGFDVEAAQSRGENSQGDALRFALRDSRRPVRFYALGWSADPEFLGPLHDKLYLSTGFDYPHTDGWGARGYYRLQNWQMVPVEVIDPDVLARTSPSDRMQAGPRESESSLGTGHPLGRGSATLDVYFRERADVESTSWRAGLNQAWRGLSIFYSLERGSGRDLASGARFDTSSQVFSSSLRIGRFQTYGVYWMRDEHGELDPGSPAQESAGLSAIFGGGSGFRMSLDAQRTESRFGRSAIYDLSMVHQAERGGRIALAARRLEGRFARTDFMLSYSLPFGMPVARRGDVSTVRGRVFDADSSVGLQDVVLRLDGMSVATNKRGEFVFPAVSAGVHEVYLGGGEVDKIPANGTTRVAVSGRQVEPVLIGMVRAVVIDVAVTLRPGGGQDANPAPGVLVIFRNGDTVFRRLTDATGRARLGGVPPGRWTLEVSEDSLPAGYHLAGGAVPIELSPGQAAAAELPLTREPREMRMQPPLAVR